MPPDAILYLLLFLLLFIFRYDFLIARTVILLLIVEVVGTVVNNLRKVTRIVIICVFLGELTYNA